MVLHVRLDRTTGELIRRISRTIRAVEPRLAVSVQSSSEATAFALVPLQVASVVLGLAGGVAVVLAWIGVFGLVAYAVAQRAREIAIRVALGATTRLVAQRVAADGLLPVAGGILVGTILSFAAGGVLRALLVGITPNDLLSHLVVIAALLAVTAFALIVPVARATRLDPAAVLRE